MYSKKLLKIALITFALTACVFFMKDKAMAGVEVYNFHKFSNKVDF
jgi:hypothetical protein